VLLALLQFLLHWRLLASFSSSPSTAQVPAEGVDVSFFGLVFV
jgi:hypothetical protein